jgi:hypothetical protein
MLTHSPKSQLQNVALKHIKKNKKITKHNTNKIKLWIVKKKETAHKWWSNRNANSYSKIRVTAITMYTNRVRQFIVVYNGKNVRQSINNNNNNSVSLVDPKASLAACENR